MFVQLSELKDHLRITQDDIDFDRELPRFLSAAEVSVLKYLNRNVYAELPAEPEPNDIVIDDSIKLAILDVAAYMFDNKAMLDRDMVTNIMDATVSHYRIMYV